MIAVVPRRTVLHSGAAAAVLSLLLLFGTAPQQAQLGTSGSVHIRHQFAGSEIVVRASARFAGAIDSLTWRGKEYINRYDHGRQLQSASSFNRWGECFNPTEAGSRDDGRGPTSSSRLLSIEVSGNRLVSKTRMAFWLAPGQTSRHCSVPSAVNKTVLSDHDLTKAVTIGAHGLPNVIEHAVTFHVPAAYDIGVFEALTAYLPPTFSRFWAYDPWQDRLTALSDGQGGAGPGGQAFPVIIATPDGEHALGVYSPDLPQPGRRGGYGLRSFAHFKGEGNATVKWNCVFRIRPVAPGDHRFTCYSIVGTLEQVKTSIHQLAGKFPRRDQRGR